MRKLKLWGIVILILIITIGFCANYVFFKPTTINAFIAAKVYKAPANSSFNDDNLYKLVVDAYNEENGTDLPYTTNLTDEQLETILYLTIECDMLYDEETGNQYCSDESIVNDLTGLEKLTSLLYLGIYDMPYQTLDISFLTSLTSLVVMYTNITEIDVSKNTELTYLSLGGNEITNLDVTSNIKLTDLEVWENELTSINVENNTDLENLDISDNNLISSLDVTKNTKLQELSAANTKITGIDVSKNTDLRVLDLGEEIMWGMGCGGEDCQIPVYQSYITSLNLSNNTLLEELYIDNAPIQSIDLSENTKLQVLSVTSTNLTSLDLTRNIELTSLKASKSKLESLNLGNAPIEELELSSTKLSSLVLNEYQNQLTELDVEGVPIKFLDVSKLTNLGRLYVSGTDLTSLDISKNVNLTSLSIGKVLTDGSGIVGDFTLTNINLEKNVKLEYLFISKSDIENLNISKNVNLENLYILNTPIKELNLDTNTKISDLSISTTEIENLSLKNIEGIRYLSVYDTPLKSLEFGDVSELYAITLNNTNIKQIDLSSFPNLDWFDISENDFGEELYVYKGNSIKVNNMVKLPDDYETTDIEWTSDDINKASVDNDGLVKTKSSGVVNISGLVQEYYDYYQEYYDVYTTTSVVNIVEITSDNYIIDEENSLINITDSDVDTIKSNINVPEGITLDIDLDNNKLYVKQGSGILKEFDLNVVNLGSNITSDNEITLDESIVVNENKKYFSNIDFSTNVTGILDKISTNKEVIVTNKNNEVITGEKKVGTGSKVIIKSDDVTYQYMIVIYGDTDGDGDLMLPDIMKIANYIYVNKNSLKGAFLEAADYTQDKTYNIQDIMKPANKLYGGGN